MLLRLIEKEISLSRVTSVDYPYARALQESKWQSRNLRDAEINYKEGKIEISDKIQLQDNELLKRCLVGFCTEETKERPTLADIRRWPSLNWTKAYGANIYELSSEMFLFEFPNRFMAEQSRQGQWRWKNYKFQL